jgi:hypothetical protein
VNEPTKPSLKPDAYTGITSRVTPAEPISKKAQSQ